MKIVKNDRPDVEEAVRANDGYCPCAIIKDEDTKCMCKESGTLVLINGAEL